MLIQVLARSHTLPHWRLRLSRPEGMWHCRRGGLGRKQAGR